MALVAMQKRSKASRMSKHDCCRRFEGVCVRLVQHALGDIVCHDFGVAGGRILPNYSLERHEEHERDSTYALVEFDAEFVV